jgi:predicted phage gp36 major capsid-like protein
MPKSRNRVKKGGRKAHTKKVQARSINVKNKKEKSQREFMEMIKKAQEENQENQENQDNISNKISNNISGVTTKNENIIDVEELGDIGNELEIE